jgi:hypothetical protein
MVSDSDKNSDLEEIFFPEISNEPNRIDELTLDGSNEFDTGHGRSLVPGSGPHYMCGPVWGSRANNTLAALKNGWRTGTAVRYTAFCPPKLNGNANNIYLTTMNRASLGCESLISYFAQNTAVFVVYDWALPPIPDGSRRRLIKPLSVYNKYIKNVLIGGGAHYVIGIQNSTFTFDGVNWENKIDFLEYRTGSYENIYASKYTATEAQQKSMHPGWWGPCIEIWELPFTLLPPLGAFNIFISQLEQHAFRNWYPLTAQNSEFRFDRELALELQWLDQQRGFGAWRAR